jgi:hypothetical protein
MPSVARDYFFVERRPAAKTARIQHLGVSVGAAERRYRSNLSRVQPAKSKNLPVEVDDVPRNSSIASFG